MKRMVRMILALTLLVVVAQPMFAVCISCLSTGDCGQGENSYRCKPTIDGCISGGPCSYVGFASSLASEYRIASVEITHGTDATVQVAEKKTAQPQTARVAEARK
ncbi:MAG TPA: hypothetical protein VF266_05280 [Thermoanaerobaculia bacterium]